MKHSLEKITESKPSSSQDRGEAGFSFIPSLFRGAGLFASVISPAMYGYQLSHDNLQVGNYSSLLFFIPGPMAGAAGFSLDSNLRETMLGLTFYGTVEAVFFGAGYALGWATK